MSLRIKAPGRLDVDTKLFGQFTVKDLTRLLTPAALAYFTNAPIPVLASALVLGAVWYRWTPLGHHLDQLAYHAPRWFINKRQLKAPSVAPHRDEYVRLDRDTIAAVIQVSPTNLDMKTDTEQGALHNIYQDLLDTVTYPIHIHSQQRSRNLRNYKENIWQRGSPGTDLGEHYSQYINSLSEEEQSTTKHYIILKSEKDTGHWLLDKLQYNNYSRKKNRRSELDNRCREVITTLNTADLQAERLTESSLKSKVHRFSEGNVIIGGDTGPQTSPTWNSRREDYNSSHQYRKTLYISEYPSSVELGWPLQLLRTDGLIDVTQVIEPRDTGKATRKLQRISEKLNAEIDSFLSHGYRGTNKLESLLEDTEWILDLFADRKAQPVDHAVYITAHSKSKTKCRQTLRQIKNRLDTQQIKYGNTFLRTDQAYKTQQPLYPDPLNETQLVPSTTAAAGFPFGTQQTGQRNGVIYGVDTSDEAPILADRFQWPSHSMARMGMVGSGKSYAAKIELLRADLVYDDLQIIAVDPKKEYHEIIQSLDGTCITLPHKQSLEQLDDQHLCFQVEERGQRDDVDELVDLVQDIYSYTSKNQRKTLVLIDEARILMNHETGRQVLNQFVLEGRDTNTAVTLISQNASHFTYCREGREILDNMPCKVFMRHDRVPDDVVEYFQLSDRERQELHELKTGTESEYSEALLKISGKLDTRIKIESTDIEHQIINQGENQ
ncbi:ATP-binding protein [Halobellus clavatus]|uniref:AAA-like domain-containing protein n=1 Tax=Halobellus clavatus TaxID=660517 RepID=A0A1H3DJ60_9EURY|nr:ATP-binding protein [Halobellus clavatus]SDX65699.1 AAA-like domain-containing protein [Halobellus clavatus]